MQQLKQLYRSNYAGENIVSSLTLHDGEWDPITEFVPNQVINTHTTTQAVTIGNGESRKDFNLALIGDHRGGLLATDKLQTYGCNALYRDFIPDFLVAVGDVIINEIANSSYVNENIVYTNAASLLDHPGKFYLIPQNVSYDAGSLAAYMACFDGHKKVFLIGYDQYDDSVTTVNNIYKDTNGYLTSKQTQNARFFSLTLHNVMTTYSNVEFIRVMPEQSWWIPPELLPLPNFRQIDYNQFTIEADLGAMGNPGIVT
jgi:hypothetical protein